MEPFDESTDEETSSKSPSVWWKRQTYDYATYRLDSDGIIQKIHHDPDGEELDAKTRGRAKTPPPKGGLKKRENSHGDRGTTPVSFKPLARPPKYFVQGARTSSITNESFGPTKLEMSSFKSSDSEGHNAWHSSQSPHDLDVPLPETPTPRLVGTTYVHRNTTDGGYQVWVWCNREGGEFAWYPVDLTNEQFPHPKISNSHVLHEAVEFCDLMPKTVSQTLIRDGDGWFVLMDGEESPAAVWHRQAAYAPSSLMSWRDSKKVIESEDETADHGNRSDSDTESQTSMVQNSPTSSNIPYDHEIGGATKNMTVANDRTPILRNATIQLPEQKAVKSATDPDIQEPASNSSRDRSSRKGAYVEDNPDTPHAFAGATEITNDQSGVSVVPSAFPKPAVSIKLVEETGSSNFPIDPNSKTQEPQTRRLFVLEELDRFGDFVMMQFPLPYALFKMGALMYLLFLIRVLQKIWTMFQSQPLVVGFGNLGLSIVLLILIRQYVPERVKLQVDQSHIVPETIVDSCIFVGAFTCVSIIWQMVSIIGDFISY
ncbi:hypothetical protein EV360DRAFT_66808 [Lentinula raphanica]|nr:hypothetical protein EV360DRAFT_66808 [Lentinula raphanica]